MAIPDHEEYVFFPMLTCSLSYSPPLPPPPPPPPPGPSQNRVVGPQYRLCPKPNTGSSLLLPSPLDTSSAQLHLSHSYICRRSKSCILLRRHTERQSTFYTILRLDTVFMGHLVGLFIQNFNRTGREREDRG